MNGADVEGQAKVSVAGNKEAPMKSQEYTSDRVFEYIRALAPNGVDVVFDHVGGASLRSSYDMLRPGGLLLSYGNTSASKGTGSVWWPFLSFFGLKALWSFRPGRRRMTFFDVWGRGSFGADHMFRPRRFWREFREDLGQLVELLRRGQIKPHVARRVSLLRAAEAIAEHQRGGVTGKIVLQGFPSSSAN
jgi:NADPH:quinone reductase-like Zn-dependent oxidoreductase